MPDPNAKTQLGRPLSQAARSHDAIMDAAFELIQEKSARDVTMEDIARRAGVGKPTLYKWWPTKAALLMAMFHERVARTPARVSATTVEAGFRARMRSFVTDFNGLMGKVMADMIAEGQSDPKLLQELNDYIRLRRAKLVAEIERGKQTGEFLPHTDPELIVDMLVGPLYYRMLLGFPPLNRAYAEALTHQVLQGIKDTGAGSARAIQALQPRKRAGAKAGRSLDRKARPTLRAGLR